MTATGSYEFAATGPIDISLRMHSGGVSVTAVDHPVVLVTLTPEDGSESSQAAVDATVVVFDGHQLRVETSPRPSGWLSLRRGRVRANLSVPLDSTLSAHLGSADLRTNGRLGAVKANTGSGDVKLLETGGDVECGLGQR